MRLRLKILLVMWAGILVACVALSYGLYAEHERMLLDALDNQLYNAALFAKSTLPDDYHDLLVDGRSVSPADYDRIVSRYNRLCRDLGFQYLWSCMLVDGKVVFTSSTSPGKNLKKGDHAKLFEVHNDPRAFDAVFGGMEPDFSSFRNQWGHGRMVLLPFVDRHGRKYCFGASISVNEVDAALDRTLRQCIAASAILLLVGLGVSYPVAASLSRPLHGLTEVARRIAEGELNQTARFGGCSEVASLSATINRMSAAIREQIEEIQRGREDLQITLNSIGDAVIATDAEGRVRRMNPVAERLTGWTDGEAAGKPLPEVFRIVNAFTRETAEDPVAAVMREGKPVGLANHTALIARDGTEYQIADSGAPIRTPDGEIVGVVLVFRDVTRQYRLEQQLRHAHKMDALGRLAGGVAHDFNNQLLGILGYAELLAEHPDDPRRRDHAETIRAAALRASELTRQLLAFARKGRYEAVPVNVHALVREVTRLLSHSIDPRIEIVEALEAEPSCVVGDRGQIENALLNLGLNARDAMPEGGRLVFETEAVDLDETYCRSLPYEIQAGPYLRVSVSDTGRGMPKDVVDRVFEPFFTTKDLGEGTGMGLAAVYGTVKQHGGAINVYSEVGVGTTFRVYLPLTDEPAAEEAREDRRVVRASREAKVLVVDDEEIVRAVAKDLLESIGYEVETAEDGAEGLELYRERGAEFALVILDMMMPRMNGPQTFHALREIAPDVRVLIASGYSISGEAEALLRAGARGFIQKPFDRGELSSSVARALGEA